MSEPARTPAPPEARAGEGLELSFACPECEHVSWVTWERLGQGVRCSACHGWFTLDRHGQLKSGKPIRHFQYKCPRCREPGELPAARLSHGATCQACQLELLPGPDKRLHDRPELEAIKRQSRMEALRRRAAQISPVFWTESFRMSSRGLALMCGAVAALVIIVAVAFAFQESAGGDSLPRRFTEQLLADQNDAAAEQVAEFQEDEFRRWRILHFASIRDSIRPPGDRVRITVEPLTETDSQKTFRVNLASPFLGERKHGQCWRLVNNRWVFDAAASKDIL